MNSVAERSIAQAQGDLFVLAYYPELYDYLQQTYQVEDLLAPLLEANTPESIEFYLELDPSIDDPRTVRELMTALSEWDPSDPESGDRVSDILEGAGFRYQNLIREVWSTWIFDYLQENNTLPEWGPESPYIMYTLSQGNTLLLDQLIDVGYGNYFTVDDVQSAVARFHDSNRALRLGTWMTTH
jgi:hypothetical protein